MNRTIETNKQKGYSWKHCALEPKLHPVYYEILKLGQKQSLKLFSELNWYFIRLVFGIVSKMRLASGKVQHAGGSPGLFLYPLKIRQFGPKVWAVLSKP